MSSAFVISIPDAAAALPLSVSGLPDSGTFWAVMAWVVVPGFLMIWLAYQSRQERLRGIHRKLRQLELRLAASTPAQSAIRATLPRESMTARASSMTARILLPPSVQSSPVPVFRHPLPGQVG